VAVLDAQHVAPCFTTRVIQDLMNKVAAHAGTQPATVMAKVQGPFEGEDMTASEELIYTHMVVFAGGIGATAVLPMVKRTAMRRANALAGMHHDDLITRCTCSTPNHRAWLVQRLVLLLP
jgi:hypothetical protein